MADRSGARGNGQEAGHGLVHPFTKALYEMDGEGGIRVVDGDRWGRFTVLGEWVEGDIRYADPQICGWVGGARVRHHRLQVHDD